MALFGKKKKKENEEDDIIDEELEEKREEKKVKRKLKDLSPENRKKRKEPPKPWGKKERITVLVIFLVMALAASIMTLAAEGSPIIKNFINIKNAITESIKGFKSDTVYF